MQLFKGEEPPKEKKKKKKKKSKKKKKQGDDAGSKIFVEALYTLTETTDPRQLTFKRGDRIAVDVSQALVHVIHCEIVHYENILHW